MIVATDVVLDFHRVTFVVVPDGVVVVVVWQGGKELRWISVSMFSSFVLVVAVHTYFVVYCRFDS